MDFSSLNPITTNALNLAARQNDASTVIRLLKKMNPNCIDNRGWTCLHEAAASDSYESLVMILKHPDCRPLAETHEGHTALYLACRHKASLKTINLLLESAEDIANYGSTESVTPLHVVCSQGRVEVIQLLIQYGAIIDVQDFDGATPMHDAALASQPESVNVLLHAGADPEIKNDPSYTPFHFACCKGCLQTVQNLYPFITNINQRTSNGDTPLMLALKGANDDIIHFLLDNGADPHIKNNYDELALNMALTKGYNSIFKTLLNVTNQVKINRDIILFACKPHYFKFEILEDLLNHNLGPEFFDFVETLHVTLEQIGDIKLTYLSSTPLNSFLNICEYIYNHNPDKFREFFYLFLMRGVSVNALDVNECPPLVYIHYSAHSACFADVFKIFEEHGCNIDHCSVPHCTDKDRCMPDAFIASLTSDPTTAPIMLPCSLHCDPDHLLDFAYENGVLHRIPIRVQNELLAMVNSSYYMEGITAETLTYFVSPLKHLCRLKIRSTLRNRKGGVKDTRQYLDILNSLKLPYIVRNYLRYL